MKKPHFIADAEREKWKSPFYLLLAFLFFTVPYVGFAQVNDVFGLSILIYNILVKVGVLFWALAVMLFVWGVVKFIANANDTTEHEAGKKFIVWGIISFVALTSLWGVVSLVLSDTLNITPGGHVEYRDKNNNVVK